MAASSSKSLTSLSGTYKLNKTLCTIPITSILALQGTSYIIRNAIAAASVTLEISQPNSNEYHVKQTASAAAIPGTSEQYHLDNVWRTNEDAFFGKIRGRARWVSIEQAKGIEGVEGTWEVSEADGGKVLLAEGGKEDGKWGALRVWGFQEIEGERRWVQSVKVWNKEGEEARGKMVYDFMKDG